MKRWLIIFAIVILIVIGFLYGRHSASQLGGNVSAAPAARSNLDRITTGTSVKKLWGCPMHPQVTSDQPGVCPICGMDLVEMEPPNTSQPGAPHSHGVHLDTASQQRLGVRLAAAEWRMLSQDIHAYGNVVADESLIFNLSAKVEGVIKKLHINSVGQRIEAGDVIYEIYSPELLKSQREFIELLKENDLVMFPPDTPPDAPDPHTSGKGMSEYQMMEMRDIANRRIPISEKFYYADAGIELIDELYRTYVPREVVEIHAPKSGFVTKIDVHEGSAVKPMDNLFSFADSSRVWLDVPLYPDQLAWVKNGDEVTVKLRNAPEIKARLKFITPLVDNTTRTLQARLSVNNPRNRLLIGSFLDVIIHAKPHKALVVPRSAVMRTGKGDWVMLSGGAGHFTPVKVETGIEAADSIEITTGLQVGDQIAVNGQFLLDAAASMSDTAQRLHHDIGKH